MRQNFSVLIFFAFCLAAIILPSKIAAADIIQQSKLTFGKWAVTNNSSQHSITVNPNGSYVASSPALVMISPPSPGVYMVTGLPAFHSVASVSVVVNYNMQGDGPGFLLDNFTTQIPPSDAAGNTTLTLGARARTTGNSTGYGDDTYVGELNIEINL